MSISNSRVFFEVTLDIKRFEVPKSSTNKLIESNWTLAAKTRRPRSFFRVSESNTGRFVPLEDPLKVKGGRVKVEGGCFG